MLKFKTSCAVLANLSSNLLNEVGLSLFRYFEVGLRVCDIVVNKYVRYLISWWVLVYAVAIINSVCGKSVVTYLHICSASYLLSTLGRYCIALYCISSVVVGGLQLSSVIVTVGNRLRSATLCCLSRNWQRRWKHWQWWWYWWCKSLHESLWQFFENLANNLTPIDADINIPVPYFL